MSRLGMSYLRVFADRELVGLDNRVLYVSTYSYKDDSAFLIPLIAEVVVFDAL